MDSVSLVGGFETPSIDCAKSFRGVMTAMARPGQIQEIAGARPPAPLSQAAGAVLLTLCDVSTDLHLGASFDTPAIRDWITFQTGAPMSGPDHAQFVLCRWGEVDLTSLAIGTPEYPDRSATVIVEMPDLTQSGARLSGPGIRDEVTFGLPETALFQRNRALFPLGLDFLFTCGTKIAALPRSTIVSD